MKKLCFLVCLLLTVCLVAVGCADEDTITTEDAVQSTTSIQTTGVVAANTTAVLETTAPATTAVVTTAVVTTAPETTQSIEEILAENVYASAGLELVLNVCEQYYDMRTHTLATSLENRGATTVWPLASYIEMLATAYRTYPENETIKTYYEAALKKCLRKHMVTGATIKPPSGEVYTNQMYYNAGPNSQGDFYYDDNAWICIQLFDAYQLLGDEMYLRYAEKLLEFFWTGWDERAGGGIYWDKTFSGKGICTNGPITISYCIGYQLTGNEEYLEKAKMIYDWVNRLLRSPKDGLYNAGVKDLNVTVYRESNLDPWRPAYDQGTMLSAASLLYQITKEEKYLTDLTQTANNAIGLIFEGNVMKRNPIFKAWCIGWIMRGEMLVHEAGEERACKNFMRRMQATLNNTLKTKDANGHYDPFFCSKGTDFWDKDYFDTDALMPTGVATVLLLYARYQIFQAN